MHTHGLTSSLLPISFVFSSPDRFPSALSWKVHAKRCELLRVIGDVIINDPVTSEAKDLTNKMWNLCFYKHISQLRSDISKQKSLAKKRQAGGAGELSSPKRALLSGLEKQYSDFLGQSVTYYEWLTKQILKDLAPLTQTQSSDDDSLDDEITGRSIVILYKTHLHLGDLHRYNAVQRKEDAGCYKRADGCYLRAAALSRGGMGNPYNQLAVVAQSGAEPLTAVALYFYARSLQAVDFPFETSRQNIVRLFEQNRKWLGDHDRDGRARGGGARGGTTRGIVDVGGGSGLSRKEQKEMLNREQRAANRKALCRLADLQWDFFRGVSLGDGGDGRVGLNDLVAKMTGLVETFAGLTSNSAFSEGLLCKLVSILAFTTLGAANEGKPCNAAGIDARNAKDPKFDEGELMANQALAFSFFLRFASLLARHTREALVKKGGGGAKLGSVKTLPPLLLCLGFVDSVYSGSQWFHGLAFFTGSLGSDTAFRRLCEDAHEEFWTEVGAVADILDRSQGRDRRQSVAAPACDLRDVRDFVEFRGFVPFASFLDKDGDPSDWTRRKKSPKYASVEEALDALTPRTAGGKNDSNDKGNILVSIVDKVTSQTNDDGPDGRYFLFMNSATKQREYLRIANPAKEETANKDKPEEDDPEETQLPSSPANEVAVAIMDLDEDDEAGDTVLNMDDRAKAVNDENAFGLKYSDQGLLTPAALLANAATQALPSATAGGVGHGLSMPPQATAATLLAPGDFKSGSALANSGQVAAPEPTNAAVPPPPGLMPPPGFASSTAPPPNAGGGLSLADLVSPPVQQNLAPAEAFMNSQMHGVGMLSNSGSNAQTLLPDFPKTSNPWTSVAPSAEPRNDGIGAPPGMLNPGNIGGGLLGQINGASGSAGPSLDFLLGGGKPTSAPDPFGFAQMPQSNTNQSTNDQSLLNFLFEHTTKSEEDQTKSQFLGFPQLNNSESSRTQNPFAYT